MHRRQTGLCSDRANNRWNPVHEKAHHNDTQPECGDENSTATIKCRGLSHKQATTKQQKNALANWHALLKC